MGDFLREFALAALGTLGVLGSSFLLIRASRRDRAFDERKAAEKQVQENERRLDRHAETIWQLVEKTGINPRFQRHDL